MFVADTPQLTTNYHITTTAALCMHITSLGGVAICSKFHGKMYLREVSISGVKNCRPQPSIYINLYKQHSYIKLNKNRHVTQVMGAK